jgi:hypothetical protein
LEPVTELSSVAFLVALRRFVSRRGVPTDVHSDNGTNFVGAEKELRELRELTKSEAVSRFAADQGINWHFIPPGAPHQRGLWEAGVKSTKYHLRRVIGHSTLTLEELWTLLCQIEAALNSRPLCALTDDPSSYDVLTPGHFIIGQPLTALPDEDLTDAKMSRLTRWQHVTRMFRDFRKRWNAEYLTSLQQRYKWKKKTTNVQVGDLVLIREDHIPPLKWRLARITAVHKGKDDLVRIVTLKTANGELTRPLTKIAPLLTVEE